MRTELPRNRQIEQAWELRNNLHHEAHTRFPEQPSEIGRADEHARAANRKRLIAEGDAIFAEAVVRFHGPATIIDLQDGTYKLYHTSN